MAKFYVEKDVWGHTLQGEDVIPGNIDHAIQKWKYIASLDDHVLVNLGNIGGTTCSLCQKYKSCANCPVAIETGMPSCRGTHYYDFAHATRDGEVDSARKYAKKMLALLRRIKRKIANGEIKVD